MINQFLKNINTVRALQLFHLFRFGVALLTGIVLVKVGMTTNEVSHYEYFLFISAFVSFFWTNGILKSMMSLYSKYDSIQKRQLLTNTLILLLILGILSVILLYITNLFYGVLEGHIFIYFALFIVFSAIGSMGELILVLKDKARTLLSYGIVIFLVQAILVIGAIIVFKDLNQVIMALVIYAFLRMVYSFFLLSKYGSKSVSRIEIGSVVLFALPLVGDSLMGNAMEYVDGFLVKHFFDDSIFGIYRYGARELPFSVLFIGVIGTATLPILVSNMSDGLEQLKRELSHVMRWLFPLSIVLMLTSPYIFTWVYSVDYIMSARVFNIYLLVLVSRVLMPQVVLLGMHKNYLLLLFSIFELVLNLGLSIVFLKFFGLIGIPIASLVVYILIKISMILFIKQKYGISLSSYIHFKSYIIYTILISLSYLISTLYL